MNNNLKTNRKKKSGHSQTFYRFSFQRVKKMLSSQAVAVTTDEILGLAQILAGGLTSGTGSVWKEVKSLKAKKRSRGRRRRFGFASFLRFVYTLRLSTRLKILWVDPERSRSRHSWMFVTVLIKHEWIFVLTDVYQMKEDEIHPSTRQTKLRKPEDLDR